MLKICRWEVMDVHMIGSVLIEMGVVTAQSGRSLKNFCAPIPHNPTITKFLGPPLGHC